jgi:LEA14-like dessication related protein
LFRDHQVSGTNAYAVAVGASTAHNRAMTLALRLFLLLAPTLLLVGCAGFQAIEPVRVSLADLQLTEASGLEQRYRVRLRVSNPNPEPLHVAGVDYDLFLNGAKFLSGLGGADTVVPAYGDAVVDTTATSTVFGIARQIQSLGAHGGGGLTYRIEGRLAVAGRLSRVSFQQQGELFGQVGGPGTTLRVR